MSNAQHTHNRRPAGAEPAASAPPEEGPLGHPLVERDEVDSTNDLLKSMAADGAPEGTTVVARAQTRGRGQPGRRWHSPPDLGLYLSVLLRPPWPAGESGPLALLAGLALAAACDALGIPHVRLKWPNDVLADGRKIGGVLVEPTLRSGRVEYAVIGIGLNLQQAPEDFPPELQATATSCRQAGVTTDSAAARVAVLRELNRWYATAKTEGLDQLYSAWAKRAHDSLRAERKAAAPRLGWKAKLYRSRSKTHEAR